VALGLSAGELLKAGLPAIGGRGGGKAEFAQGGGSEAGGIAAAFAAIAALIGERAGSREE
jgi:alanyl-tRNA synthetase